MRSFFATIFQWGGNAQRASKIYPSLTRLCPLSAIAAWWREGRRSMRWAAKPSRACINLIIESFAAAHSSSLFFPALIWQNIFLHTGSFMQNDFCTGRRNCCSFQGRDGNKTVASLVYLPTYNKCTVWRFRKFPILRIPFTDLLAGKKLVCRQT